MENEDLTLSKIKKKVEGALGISIPGNHDLKVSASYLDALARRKPNDYLSILEEAKSILDHPDFVSFDEKRESLCYYRTYYESGFIVVGVSFLPLGVPRCFYLMSIKKNPLVEGKIVRIERVNPKKG